MWCNCARAIPRAAMIVLRNPAPRLDSLAPVTMFERPRARRRATAASALGSVRHLCDRIFQAEPRVRPIARPGGTVSCPAYGQPAQDVGCSYEQRRVERSLYSPQAGDVLRSRGLLGHHGCIYDGNPAGARTRRIYHALALAPPGRPSRRRRPSSPVHEGQASTWAGGDLSRCGARHHGSPLSPRCRPDEHFEDQSRSP